MRHPPLQPPLFWQVCLLFWCAGILAALWPAEGLGAALLLSLADPRLKAPRRALLALAMCGVGLAVGLWQLAPLRSPPAEPAWLAAAPGDTAKNPPVRICGTVLRVEGLAGAGGLAEIRLRVILEDVRPEAGGEALAGRLAWTWDDAAFRPLAGQTVCLGRRPVPMRGFANSAAPAQEARWAAQDVFWRFWSRAWSGSPTTTGAGTAPARLREDLRRDFVRALLPPQEAGLAAGVPQAKAILPALLFGDRSLLSRSTLDEFAAASLAHSLALSGQHLALAGLIGLFSVLLLARVRPGIYLFRARPLWVAVASLPPALAYLWLGNAPASLLRAACMLGLMTLWLLRGRTATLLDALLAALACIVLADPLSLFDLSLQLSVLCVAVICLTVPGLRRLWPAPGSGKPPAPGAPLMTRLAARGRAVLHGLGAIFLVSFCIQLALLPFMLARFGTLGLWFPLNVLWLPAVDLMVLPGAALGLGCAAAGLEHAARIILDMAALPCEAMLACLDFLQRHGLLEGPASLRPHWTSLAAFAALGVALAVMAGDGRPKARLKARRWLVAALLLLCAGPALRLTARLDTAPRLEIFDVGQGLAVTLRLPGHGRILVDGGGAVSPGFDTGKALLDPLLTANDAPRLDAVINTHPDLDHVGGLFHLLRNFRVEQLFHNGRDARGERRDLWREARRQAPAAALAAGDKVLLGGWGAYALEVLHPPRMPAEGAAGGEKTPPWSGNDASLVLRLTRNGEGLVLFTGDAGPAVLRRLLAEGADLSARILVAPHHGSDGSFLPAFHEAARPELVLAGCGFRNRWGYPGRRLRAWLAARHIPLLDTGTHGKISVELPENGPLRVDTARKAP